MTHVTGIAGRVISVRRLPQPDKDPLDGVLGLNPWQGDVINKILTHYRL
ncbi:MAG: hypothetical protein ACYTGY_08765 [Planctomycetota bacterium]|jgi:hypothetical protein